MSGWSDAATWVGEGLRREVFFFESRGRDLYGSLYAAKAPSRPFGVVVCPSWGVEAARMERFSHGIALELARRGGAGLVFHYPGYGDSYGDLEHATMDLLTAAAVDATAEAYRRRPDAQWILAGMMLGGSVASLAQREAGVDRLLLVQPALRPSEYFGKLARSAKRIPLPSGGSAETAFGFALPREIVAVGTESDADVETALAGFRGDGAVIRYADGDCAGLPNGFEQVSAEGSWRFGAMDYPELERATIDWLDRRTESDAR